MCKVSILVPVYNVQQYLPKCLDSILAQTLFDIEIICIDDGSTDKSGEILDDYAKKDDRFRIVHQKNGGYGKAVNTGLRIARGEYIGIVESDDFVAPDMYEKLYLAAERNATDIAKSNYYRYWGTPKEKIKAEPLLKNLPCDKVIHPLAYERLFYIQPSVWSAIYSRKFLEYNKICFLETPGAAYQDTSFTFKVMAAAERAVLLKDALVYYRQDNANSSVHSKEKASFILLEYREINRFLDENESDEALYKIRNLAMTHTYLWNYVRLKEELCEDFLKEMGDDFLRLQRSGQLDISELPKTEACMLKTILEDRNAFISKERMIMPLRKILPNRVYHALLIGRIAGLGCMVDAVIKKLLRV